MFQYTLSTLTVIARRNLAQSALQAARLRTETRRIQIGHRSIERVLDQLEVVRLQAIQCAGMIEPDRQCSTECLAIDAKLLVFGDILRKQCSVVRTAQRIANGVPVRVGHTLEIINTK